MNVIDQVVKELYAEQEEIEDKYRLAGNVSWEVRGAFGYTVKGEYEAYKNLMLNLAIMEAMYKDEN